ncbi:ArsR/SmtB family transcription factor [Candidatus Clostridium radicumherbarum]|uniref:ArsR/SmtB family transcription factor n=1 Tax=Candidatus Clostridium radicumherbarum TaxID=3381662 RepID=A0ABW8TNQ7_9CLOT
MKTKNNQVSFIIHPPVEFIYALHFTANMEEMDKFFLQFNYVQVEDVKQKIDFMRKKITKYLSSELNYFFKWPEIKHVLGRIATQNQNLSSVHEFITFIEKIDNKILSSYILNQNYSDNPKVQELIISMLDKQENEDLRDVISDTVYKQEDIKEKLLECLESPEELKLRLCILLRQFYEKCYLPLEKEILEYLKPFKERYEKLFEEDNKYFFQEYLRRYSEAKDSNFIINIGYFIQVRPWTFYISPYNNCEWINIGMYTEQFPKSYMEKERIKKFLKILSDNKRFEMVELLAKKEWYGLELAAELNLTPPTVFYHINSLLDLNLVTFRKDGNKTYYKLNKIKLEELSQGIAKAILS